MFCSFQPYTSLVIFISKYYILFDATVNGNTFLNSFSRCSLLVYKHNSYLYIDFVPCSLEELGY